MKDKAAAGTLPWLEANQRYLMAALNVLYNDLESYTARVQETERIDANRPLREYVDGDSQDALHEAASDMASPPALEILCSTFGLSSFERNILLMCSGIELNSRFVRLCASAQGDPSKCYPTFSLALAAFSDAHWSAITPAAPLRYWRLIETGTGSVLTQSPLRIDERILHYLAGTQYIDERLAGIIEPVELSNSPLTSHQLLARRIRDVWFSSDGISNVPVVQLYGDDSLSKRSIAASACSSVGIQLSAISADSIPAASAELAELIRLWEREAALGPGALMVDCDDLDRSDASKASMIGKLIERARGAMIVSSRMRLQVPMRRMITIEVPALNADEQYAIWKRALGKKANVSSDCRIVPILSQFHLSETSIHAACAEALGKMPPDRDLDNAAEGSDVLDDLIDINILWDACRTQARPRLNYLAQRIEPAAGWDDLILPEKQLQILQEIAVHVRQRARVYDDWGFASQGSRGLGISVLFSGASGTGKTMAAEVLANELRLDLYRIDLSQVVSKYIGETEKNLRRVFDAAEEGGAILLFDEADALFGKRSEVKDSHDRYANIEVSYLLQRMESYRGLAILTTNMKSALDVAFLRRIRFVIQFPFPDAAQRAAIWQRIFPRKTPTEDLDMEKLSRLNITGGSIRNIAVYSAFLAADEGKSVEMAHILCAVKAEYAKIEQPLTGAEIGGWL
jgi:hypothetical protein